MSGLDLEGVLTAHEKQVEERVNADDPSLRDYCAVCTCRQWNAFDHGGYHRAHVAAVLHAQIEGALAVAKADGWDERDVAGAQYLGPSDGHYAECMGWEDCYCASYPNPYRTTTPPPNLSTSEGDD